MMTDQPTISLCPGGGVASFAFLHPRSGASSGFAAKVTARSGVSGAGRGRVLRVQRLGGGNGRGIFDWVLIKTTNSISPEVLRILGYRIGQDAKVRKPVWNLAIPGWGPNSRIQPISTAYR
jgi:hypothetical protein